MLRRMLLGLGLLAPVVSPRALAEESSPTAKTRPSLKTNPLPSDKSAKKAKLRDPEPEARPAWLLPSWGTPSLSMQLMPLFSYQAARSKQDDSTSVTTQTTELGLILGLRGVPLIPGNPGLTIGPRAGHAIGAVRVGDESSQYRRTWGDLQTTLYWHWYRHTLTLGYGEKSSEGGAKLRSALLGNDFGVLFIDWLSGHLTHTLARGTLASFANPLLETQDYWLHATMTFTILDFFLDWGPGLLLETENPSAINTVGTDQRRTQTDYFRADFSLRLFWKLGAFGSARYSLAGRDPAAGLYPALRLPEESPQDRSLRAMPSDSLRTRLFVGFVNLWGGLGIGQYWNQTLDNATRRGGAPHRETESGIGINYQTQF